MKTLLLLAPLLLFCAPATAKSLYVQCRIVGYPEHAIAYAKLNQAASDEFIQEAVLKHVAGHIITPSTSWVIDLDSRRVFAPDNQDQEVIDRAEINSGSVRGRTKGGSSFELNRVNGLLKITRHLDRPGIILRGIPLETTSTWIFQCAANSRPAI